MAVGALKVNHLMQKRTENMKNQLNNKLREVRKDKEDTIAALKEEHRTAMEHLQSQKQTAPASTDAIPSTPATPATVTADQGSTEQPSADASTPVKSEGAASLANLTEKEIKDFMADIATPDWTKGPCLPPVSNACVHSAPPSLPSGQ